MIFYIIFVLLCMFFVLICLNYKDPYLFKLRSIFIKYMINTQYRRCAVGFGAELVCAFIRCCRNYVLKLRIYYTGEKISDFLDQKSTVYA